MLAEIMEGHEAFPGYQTPQKCLLEECKREENAEVKNVGFRIRARSPPLLSFTRGGQEGDGARSSN